MKEICKLFKSSKKEDKASSLSLSLFTPGKSFSYVNNEEKFNMIMKNLTKEKEKESVTFTLANLASVNDF